MPTENNVVKAILEVVPLIQIRKHVWIGHHCPFRDYSSKSRIFRYNSKLHVGKCYCCGRGFKDLSWFLKQVEDPYYCAWQMPENKAESDFKYMEALKSQDRFPF